MCSESEVRLEEGALREAVESLGSVSRGTGLRDLRGRQPGTRRREDGSGWEG